MKRRRPPEEINRQASAGVVDSSELLERIARILVSSGRTPEQLRRQFEKICERLEPPTNRWDPQRVGLISDLPHILARWHEDEDYLSPKGEPIALPLKGGRSLSSLAKRVLPSVPPAQSVASLIELGGVRAHGRLFLPAGRYLALNSHRAIALAYGLNALNGMMGTVEYNLRVKSDKRLFERTAINPRFPVSALPQFRRKFARRASEIMWDVDVDMRREEARRRSGRMMRLGVGFYMFEDVLGRRRRRSADPQARIKRSRRGQPGRGRR